MSGFVQTIGISCAAAPGGASISIASPSHPARIM
jgi:hypothetical protein